MFTFLPFLIIVNISFVINNFSILALIKSLEYVYVFAFALIAGRMAAKDLILCLQVYVSIAALAASFAVIQFLFQDFYIFAPTELNFYRSSAFMADANYFSIYLAFAFILSYLLAGFQFRKINIALGSIIILGIAASFSRSGLLILLFGSIGLTIYFLHGLTPFRKNLTVALVLQIVLLFALNTVVRWDRTFTDIDTFSSGRITILDDFLNQESNVLELIVGKGPGNINSSHTHLHNTYLTFLANFGWAGLTAFMFFGISVIYQVFKKIQQISLNLIFMGFFAGIAAMFLFLDAQYELVLWFVLGLFFATYYSYEENFTN